MTGEKKKKKISIGVEDFKELIEKDGYFVDKTMMIRDVMESNTKVTLFTRPRRFGKTLNQFMLRRFLEDERTADGEKTDNSALFDGLAITGCGKEILAHQQQYPVIFLSLKSAKQPDFDTAYMELKKRISEEFKRHVYAAKSGKLSEDDAMRFMRIAAIEDDNSLYTDSIGFLSRCLYEYHGRKCIILIDEYDVPLENAYFQGFYGEMTGFIRSLFESALKTNPHLEKGIITGCLRISRESIFTGLNNLQVNSVIGVGYGEAFGFTEKEVCDMLGYYGMAGHFDDIKTWYDGYRFDDKEIYNPWSIINYIHDLMIHPDAFPKAYWSNTSSNSIIRELVNEADEEAKCDLEVLMEGGTIEKPAHEDITYGDIHESQDNLWNFLFFTGYLKAESVRMESNKLYIKMSIPNTEVATVYENSISLWFDKKVKATDRSPLLHALESGDCDTASQFISEQLMNAISYFDYAENYYHGFMTGLLTGAGNYLVESNREKGLGRPDIVLKERKFMGRAMVLEIKTADRPGEMEMRCEEALRQIEERRYAKTLEDDGYKTILKYAVCFFKKGCIIRKRATV